MEIKKNRFFWKNQVFFQITEKTRFLDFHPKKSRYKLHQVYIYYIHRYTSTLQVVLFEPSRGWLVAPLRARVQRRSYHGVCPWPWRVPWCSCIVRSSEPISATGFFEAATDLRTDMAGNLENHPNGKGKSFSKPSLRFWGFKNLFLFSPG